MSLRVALDVQPPSRFAVQNYSLTHLPDAVLLRDLSALVARDRAITAALLAHVAEVDARRLYAPTAYPSMFAYCVGELRLSDEMAFKRIHAARVARRFPAIFEAIAEGRLHVSGVVMLATHLTEENADELLTEAAFKTRSEIELLLARRFPKPDVPALVQAISQPRVGPAQVAPAHVVEHAPVAPAGLEVDRQHAPGRVEVAQQHAPGRVEENRQLAPAQVEPRPSVTPLAPERFAIQFTVGQVTRDRLEHARRLLEKHITPHTFRHTAAVHLVAAGVDVTVIQSWLGHAHLDTTFLYAQANVETKRQAIEQADGATSPGRPPRWKREPALLAWLDSL